MWRFPARPARIFFNQGQVCSAGSRLYVAAQHFDRVVGGIADQAKAMKLGPSLDPSAQLGPLVSSIQRERVTRYLNEGAAAGARAAAGGNALAIARLLRGAHGVRRT